VFSVEINLPPNNRNVKDLDEYGGRNEMPMNSWANTHEKKCVLEWYAKPNTYYATSHLTSQRWSSSGFNLDSNTLTKSNEDLWKGRKNSDAIGKLRIQNTIGERPWTPSFGIY